MKPRQMHSAPHPMKDRGKQPAARLRKTHDRLSGDHHRREHQHAEQLLPRELMHRERVARERTGEQLTRRTAEGDDQRIAQEQRDRRHLQRQVIVLERQMRGQKRGG